MRRVWEDEDDEQDADDEMDDQDADESEEEPDNEDNSADEYECEEDRTTANALNAIMRLKGNDPTTQLQREALGVLADAAQDAKRERLQREEEEAEAEQERQERRRRKAETRRQEEDSHRKEDAGRKAKEDRRLALDDEDHLADIRYRNAQAARLEAEADLLKRKATAPRPERRPESPPEQPALRRPVEVTAPAFRPPVAPVHTPDPEPAPRPRLSSSPAYKPRQDAQVQPAPSRPVVVTSTQQSKMERLAPARPVVVTPTPQPRTKRPTKVPSVPERTKMEQEPSRFRPRPSPMVQTVAAVASRPTSPEPPPSTQPPAPQPPAAKVHEAILPALTGADLATWRKRLAITQRTAAERLGVQQGTVSKAEGCPRSPLGPTLYAALVREMAAERQTA
jgi:hypothetical protein